MRPPAALLGIVMGSAVALFGGLLLTFVVFLLLPEFREELSAEFMPLLQAIAWAALVAAAAVAAFVGEIRHCLPLRQRRSLDPRPPSRG